MSPLFNDPFEWLTNWHAEARSQGLPEPNAMTLSTVSPEGIPSARIVLMKDCSASGITFYTNYLSRKGQELSGNPHVALTFFWPTLERQIRVEGQAAKVSRLVSERYFSSRPRESQLGAWASEQSHEIASSDVLSKRFDAMAEKYGDQPIPCPPHWGGYIVTPAKIEFWIGKPGRLHERQLFYRKTSNETWQRMMLSP